MKTHIINYGNSGSPKTDVRKVGWSRKQRRYINVSRDQGEKYNFQEALFVIGKIQNGFKVYQANNAQETGLAKWTLLYKKSLKYYLIQK